MPPPNLPTIESDALRANLLETAVDKVEIHPSYLVLLDIVDSYRGIRNNLEELLYEISHPFRNWGLILPKLRTFVLKNQGHFRRDARGPEAFALFSAIFLHAIEDARKNEPLLSQAVESLVAYLDNLMFSLDVPGFKEYGPAVAEVFTRLAALDDRLTMHIVQGHHPIKKIAAHLLELGGETDDACDLRPAATLLKRILALNYAYWLSEEDPLPWFYDECGEMCEGWEAGKLFSAISHQQIRDHAATLAEIDTGREEGQREEFARLLALPSHLDIVRAYKEVPAKLFNGARPVPGQEAADRFAENRKLIFLFRIMDTPGLFLIHEETLREINRSLVHLIRRQTFEEIEGFLLTTLQLLKANVRKYPHTSLQCIQILGTEVFNRGNSRLVEAFLWEAVRFGFQYSSVCGVDEYWQPLSNPAHLANIRVWLNLIMQEPKWCSTLLSALIINLKLSGTCIKDTDLFQRDITRLLNHPIEPVYNLVKQFAKLMPVFYNEIGAEGLLRDVSTELDEIHRRKDILVHFLRKQSHVESTNLIVDFVQAIFVFWRTRDKTHLASFMPAEVLRQVPAEGLYIDDLHLLMGRLFAQEKLGREEELIHWDEGRLERFLTGQGDLAPSEVKRFALLVRMYRLVQQKYNLGFQELRHDLEQAANWGFPEMRALLGELEGGNTFQSLTALLGELERLREIILSDKTFEVQEDIYHKRHIAVDIPSVYGRYREKKFDALGLTFRLENLANIHLERLPKTVNLSIITRATFIRIIKCLRLYLKALRIDGITSRQLETYLSLLSNSLGIKRFSYTQYLDIFRGLSEGVKDVIYAYYTNNHENNLSIIVPQIGRENLLPKYQGLWDDDDPTGSIHRLSESFLRDLIAETFGLQHLDNFITRIYQTLESQKDLLDEESLDLLMTYNPDRVVSFLHQKNPRTNNLILLGNKGFNLTMLATDGKSVPPGFIVTTEVFRCWRVVKSFYKAWHEFVEQVRHALNLLEEQTGRQYGNPERPLLLSIRSGAAVSMPGMMATIHNVGLNEEIVEEFARVSGQEYLAWDNYRRFLQSWGMTKGLDREVFQNLMNAAKARHGVSVKRQFAPAQMKELALDYQRTIRSVGIGIPEDPWLQLTGALEMVLDSWNANKTRDYRSLMDMSEAWGTAVIIQAMVFGNLDENAGSGVVFTAHPYRKVRRVALWGDYAPGDQGEDIVSGLVATYPISVEQAELDGRSEENSLERRFPEIYKGLLALARELVYEKGWNPQEIEFTFESPRSEDLYILQTRDMITIKKAESFDVFADPVAPEAILGKGIGVSGSALAGKAVFTADNIRQLRRQEPDTPLILIRQDTVPEDIKEISMAEGLLTARGGQTSHASVVAIRLEKTCVVGCNALKVFENEERCEIDGQVIRFGDPVSIDGRKGVFLKGMHPVRKEVHILPI
jgi:pyruvate, orthophosphate dikinase